MDSISGTYSCTLSQDKGPVRLRRRGTLTLEACAGALRGTMFPTMFWLDSPFTGGVCEPGGAFSFQVRFATPCQQFTMDVSGQVRDGVLTGRVLSPMGEHRLEGVRRDRSKEV